MPSVSRRRFLQGAVALAAATGLPLELVEAALAQDPTGTTLDRTIVRLAVSGYSKLGTGPGEPHIAHPANPVPLPDGSGRTLVAFAHFTDVHLVDAQSPARVEFLDRFADHQCQPIPFASAFRPQETMSTQVQAAMVRAVNDVQLRRKAAGQAPLSFAVATGDNCDNQQSNELDWFVNVFDGDRVVPNSGAAARYEGVQSPDWGDRSYWVPSAAVRDEYKDGFGFPGEDAWGYGPGRLLAGAIAPFDPAPLAMPWFAAYGNHDGLLQGNMPANPALNSIAIGPLKAAGTPAGFDPCGSFEALQRDPTSLFAGPATPVTPDQNRRIVPRREYVDRLKAHGFGLAPAPGLAYYRLDDDANGFRFLVLDTVNPGGYADGSIGQAQFDWLADELRTAGRRYVVLFSHHGLHSLDNPVVTPDPANPEPERRVMSDEVEALLHTCPSVIAWICGHTHQNRITLRKGGNGHAFWDVETAAHIDWPCQTRIVEIEDHGDVLALRLTMVDHAGDVAAADQVLKLAGIHRELSGNDPQVDRAVAAGRREERNVVLTVAKPPLPAAPVVQPAAATQNPRGELAASGAELDRRLAGALAVAAGGVALANLARRSSSVFDEDCAENEG